MGAVKTDPVGYRNTYKFEREVTHFWLLSCGVRTNSLPPEIIDYKINLFLSKNLCSVWFETKLLELKELNLKRFTQCQKT